MAFLSIAIILFGLLSGLVLIFSTTLMAIISGIYLFLITLPVLLIIACLVIFPMLAVVFYLEPTAMIPFTIILFINLIYHRKDIYLWLYELLSNTKKRK